MAEFDRARVPIHMPKGMFGLISGFPFILPKENYNHESPTSGENTDCDSQCTSNTNLYAGSQSHRNVSSCAKLLSSPLVT